MRRTWLIAGAGLLAAALLPVPFTPAAARSFPPALSLRSVQRIVAPCGVRLVGSTPNMQTEAEGRRDRRRGGGLYEGAAKDVSLPEGNITHVGVALHLRARRVVFLDFDAPDRDTFERCGRGLVRLAFPGWPGALPWLDTAAALPPPGDWSHPGPERQAVQDDLFITVRGHTFRLLSGAFDRTEFDGVQTREPSLVVPSVRSMPRAPRASH